LDMINVIFNYKKRNEYLLKKNKVIPEHTPEILIQQKIGTRVIVDFLQLIKDFCDLENINIKSDFAVCNKDKDSICKSLKSAIDNLKIETQNNLQIIFDNVLCLIDLLKLKYEDMEKERIVVENNEGSFRNGKFVIK